MKILACLVLLSLTASCAHLGPVVTDAKECAKQAGKDTQPDLLPTFRQVLAMPDVVAFEAGAVKLVLEFGKDFVRCMFQLLGSEAEHSLQAGPPGSEPPPGLQRMKLNARNWIATNPS